MQLFALYIIILALTVYSTLNLVVTTDLRVLNPSYLQVCLLEPMLYARLYTLIRDGIFALSNVNHLSKNELNYLIESLA